MAKLAINGGTPVRTELFPAYNAIGVEEKQAVAAVLDSGILSQFLGVWSDDFFGGPTVQKFENDWKAKFGVKHAVSINSNTSGLFAAIGAIGIKPGDEVIVTPYSMSASAIAPLVYGGIPVFADIDPVTLCLDPASVEARITPRTKAILIVHIMGHPADMGRIMAIAKKHGLRVIEDCAQSPMGMSGGSYVGTIGDIGVFSFNYHKHIHTGEGGMIVTNDDDLAFRCQLIRNHAENIVGPKQVTDLTNLIGYNYRMTEIEAAIGVEQLKKLSALLDTRLENACYFHSLLEGFPALTLQPPQPEGNKHCYYTFPIRYDKAVTGVHRDRFVAALKCEIPSAVLREHVPLIGAGYVKPLYLAPIYQNRAAWAYNTALYDGNVSYERGICPVVEDMHFEKLFITEYIRPGMTKQDMQDVATAIAKIFDNIDELR